MIVVGMLICSQAERAFEAVRILEPYRMWDMEVYSTLLWHLRRKVQLAFLAQELLAVDPRAPQAWIAVRLLPIPLINIAAHARVQVGNTFSLERRRAQALSCFRRAAQLDEACAYAHTLAGHETIDEDVDRAVQEFQTALRADARHYNAWYVPYLQCLSSGVPFEPFFLLARLAI